MPEDAHLEVPIGFRVQTFAENLDAPRWLAAAPEGDILVTETHQKRIRRLGDRDGDGIAEVNEVFARAENGLELPFGMAFGPGAFYLGNHNAVRRYTFKDGQRALVGMGEVIAELPPAGYYQHFTRNVVLSPDSTRLYVTIGSLSDSGVEPLPRGSVQVMNLDGSGMRMFAHGTRNPVGLAFHPTTGALYAAVHERDGLGDDLPPDFFTRIQQDDYYGWPFTYLAPSLLDPRRVRRGKSERPALAAKTRTPDVLLQAHSAPMGLAFYSHDQFPAKYRDGAFLALRGSWNRHPATGYKVVFIPFEAGRPVGHYEDFLRGFLLDAEEPKAWGRLVGLLAMGDGSLLVAEEKNGRIFRISYAPESPP